MKRIVLTILIVFGCLSDIMAFNFDDPEGKPIPIRDLENTASTGRERIQFQPVSVFMNTSDEVLEIELYDIMSGDIYILDAQNNIVDCVDLYEGMTHTTLPLPVISGVCQVVIWCDTYKGIGLFEIE